MPWSGSGISDTALSDGGFVMDACVTSVEGGLKKAEQIGLSVMIKANEGGGGKGIRMVSQADAFKNAYHAVAGEIPSRQFFNDGSMSFC
jgi:acetyl-CoA carboxylase / biotin carboxylase 1